MPPSLLDLPDELLVEITLCVRNGIIKPLSCFAHWVKHYENVAEHYSWRNARLISLASACKRLHAIATPIMFENISFNCGSRRVRLFSSIEEGASCLHHVKSVSGLVCISRLEDPGTADMLQSYLSLPNLQSLHLGMWSPYDLTDFRSLATTRRTRRSCVSHTAMPKKMTSPMSSASRAS